MVAIVDDEKSVRRAVGRLVKCAGMEVECFASAEEFLEAYSLRAHDCLILDIRLPGMSGLELQSRLVAAGRKLPIIFVSAHDEAESRSQALQAGAVAFFGKPFKEDVLLRAVRSAFQFHDPY